MAPAVKDSAPHEATEIVALQQDQNWTARRGPTHGAMKSLPAPAFSH